MLEPSIAQHRNHVPQGKGFFLLVGHEHRRDAYLVDGRTEFPPSSLSERRIEVRQRLVEQQHAWTGSHCPSDSHSLLLATREFVHPTLLKPSQVDEGQRFRHALSPLRGAEGASEPESHVLAHVQMRKQRVVLKHHSETAVRRTERGNVFAVHCHRTRIRCLKPRYQSQRGRLPASAGAQ